MDIDNDGNTIDDGPSPRVKYFSILGDVEFQSAGMIAHQLRDILSDGTTTVQFVITSHGGIVDCSLSIIDSIRTMQQHGVRVQGRVVGYAMSAAAMILQACDWRTMSEYGHLMLHGATVQSMFFSADMKEMRKMQEWVNRGNGIYRKLLARSKLTDGAIDDLFDDNTPVYYNAKEALEAGLVDEIV